MRSHSKLFLKALNLKRQKKKDKVFFRENLVALYYFRSFIYDFFSISSMLTSNNIYITTIQAVNTH